MLENASHAAAMVGGNALVIFVALLLGQIVARKLVEWVAALPKEEAEVAAKIAALQREARRLDAVSTFVRWSKVQRQLQTLEKQRERLRSERRQPFMLDNPIALFLVKHLLAQVVVPLVIIAWWWNQPVLVAEEGTFGPWILASWLAIPGWPIGTVGVVAWVAICRSVAQLFPI